MRKGQQNTEEKTELKIHCVESCRGIAGYPVGEGGGRYKGYKKASDSRGLVLWRGVIEIAVRKAGWGATGNI